MGSVGFLAQSRVRVLITRVSQLIGTVSGEMAGYIRKTKCWKRRGWEGGKEGVGK